MWAHQERDWQWCSLRGWVLTNKTLQPCLIWRHDFRKTLSTCAKVLNETGWHVFSDYRVDSLYVKTRWNLPISYEKKKKNGATLWAQGVPRRLPMHRGLGHPGQVFECWMPPTPCRSSCIPACFPFNHVKTTTCPSSSKMSHRRQRALHYKALTYGKSYFPVSQYPCGCMRR